ncbi:MAG: cysteine peptidase family C39 domain-containing protein [Aquificaceae bacterium]
MKVIFLSISIAFAGIIDVPFYRQEKNLCAQSSLSSLLSYLNLPYSKEELNSLYRPDIRSTSALDVALFLRKKGLKAKIKNSNLEELKKSIDLNLPVIVLYSQSPLSRPHFALVVGYSDYSIFLHDGQTPYLELSFQKFEKMWSRADNLAILIEP